MAVIGRVYEAGVARAWRGEGDAETEVARVLVEHADLIDSGLQCLKDRPFERQTVAEIEVAAALLK